MHITIFSYANIMLMTFYIFLPQIRIREQIKLQHIGKTVAAVMSARLHVNKPLLRRSSLALNRINVHVGSRKGSGSSTNGNGIGSAGINGEHTGQANEGNAFEELRIFIKQVS